MPTVPGWALVLGQVENRVARGIGAEDAANIYRYVVDGRDEPTSKQRAQLAQISELFLASGYFTSAGADRWAELTAIRLNGRGVDYPKGFLPAQKLHRLRASLQDTQQRLDEKYDVQRKGRRVSVEIDGFSVEKLKARKKRPPKRTSLTHKQALSLKLPKTLFEEALANPELRTLKTLMRDLTALEAKGYADGELSPDDVDRAPAALKTVMERLYALHGRRRMPLSEVAAALPSALLDLFCTDRRQRNRKRDTLAELFTRLAEDAVAFMAKAYTKEVLEEQCPYTLVLESYGFAKPAQKGRIQPLLADLVPEPTFDEVAALYRAAGDGTLSALDFFGASGLSREDVFQLQVAEPGHFPRDPELSAQAALSTSVRSPEALNKAELEHLWEREVASGKKSISKFCRDHGIRHNRIKHLRRKIAPELLEPLPKRISKAHPRRNEQLASDLRDALERAFAQDVLQTVPEALARVNRDEAFRRVHGPISEKRYRNLRSAMPGFFPNYQLTKRWLPVVRREVLEIMTGDDPPDTKLELLQRLEKLHPRISRRRLDRLEKEYPKLPMPEHGKRSTDEVRALGRRIAARMREGVSREDAAEEAGIDVRALNGIVMRHRDLFVGVPTVREPKRYQREYRSLPARRLLDLAIQVAEPGTPQSELAAVWNALLVRGGLPPRDMSKIAHRLRLFSEQAPTKVYAATAAKIVAEYARMAPKGATEPEILDAVRADYPHFTGREIGRYRRLWNKNPGDYPALADLRNGAGKVALTGLEDPPEQPVYAGGWDLERILEHGDEETQTKLAKLSEAAEIPFVLDEVDFVLDALGIGTPLAYNNVLWVSHMLADVVPVAFALKKAGANSKNLIAVSSPYGNSDLVTESVEDIGFPVRVPELDETAYRDAVKGALIDLIKRHKRNKRPIVVMDDGGLVADIVHNDLAKDPKYAKYVEDIRIVEQTRNGILLAEKNELLVLLVNVALARIKKLEGHAIGETVGTHVIRRLENRGLEMPKVAAVVFGHGTIGGPTADVLSRADARVTVVDTNPEAVAEAAAKGFAAIHLDPENPTPAQLKALEKVLGKADYVVGASGGLSMTMQMFGWMKDGASWANISSKRSEGAIAELEEVAEKRVLPPSNPLEKLPNAEYTWNGKTITIDGDGWPFTLNGTVQHVPPIRIQFTDAAMLGGLFQICKAWGRKGLEALDADFDEQLCERLGERAVDFPKAKVYDANAWRDTIREVAGVFDVAP